MMILRLYVAKIVWFSIILVLFVVGGLNFLGVLADQMGNIEGQYNFVKVLQYALWKVPSILVESMGFSAMIGSLVGLGALANQNELTVMRASGISLLQIVGMVILPLLLFALLGVGLDQVASYANRQAESVRSVAILNTYRQAGVPDKYFKTAAIWNRQGNDFIRFDKVLSGGHVVGVTRVEFNDGRQIASLQYSQEGLFKEKTWHLKSNQTIRFGDLGFTKEESSDEWWTSELTPDRLLFISEEPDNLTTKELVDYSDFLKKQGRDNHIYQSTYWKKVFEPFALFSLVLLAVSFVFGSLRQVTISQRVFLGVMIGLVFQIGQDVAATISLVFGFSPLSGVLLPILACSLLGLFLLYRVR